MKTISKIIIVIIIAAIVDFAVSLSGDVNLGLTLQTAITIAGIAIILDKEPVVN